MTRKLAAILVADVAGYSRLMGTDEEGTLAALKTHISELIAPKISEHSGRVVKSTGDGVLAEFASVVDAARCASEIQQAMNTRNQDLVKDGRLEFRMAINLGDIIADGDDIFGDGVNVAARLEGLCRPGDIVLSGSAHEQVRGKLPFAYRDLGLQTLKNIAEPVRAYCIKTEAIFSPPTAPTLPDKPSIAVLPFTNMSGDSEQESFADGLTEDVITDLSRNAALFVIARHSTFAYKGKSVDARQIANDLGVRHLLVGSARRAAGKVRINVQLIDAPSGGHVWAERFDRNLEDIFAVQDEVTAKIVEALVGRLTTPPARNRPKSIEAYDLCVRARALIGIGSEASRESRLMVEQAIALDPSYAEAHQLLAHNLWHLWKGQGEPEEPTRSLALAAAERAVLLDQNDAGCRLVLGHLLAYERRWPRAEVEFRTALDLDPNNADAWATLSDHSVLKGRADIAVEQAQRALRLNPRPPGFYYWNLGFAQYAAHQYDSAVVTLRNPVTYRTEGRRILAASLAQPGRLEEARQEAALFMASNPKFTISYWVASQPFQDESVCAQFVEGYRKAGLPE